MIIKTIFVSVLVLSITPAASAAGKKRITVPNAAVDTKRVKAFEQQDCALGKVVIADSDGTPVRCIDLPRWNGNLEGCVAFYERIELWHGGQHSWQEQNQLMMAGSGEKDFSSSIDRINKEITSNRYKAISGATAPSHRFILAQRALKSDPAYSQLINADTKNQKSGNLYYEDSIYTLSLNPFVRDCYLAQLKPENNLYAGHIPLNADEKVAGIVTQVYLGTLVEINAANIKTTSEVGYNDQRFATVSALLTGGRYFGLYGANKAHRKLKEKIDDADNFGEIMSIIEFNKSFWKYRSPVQTFFEFSNRTY